MLIITTSGQPVNIQTGATFRGLSDCKEAGVVLADKLETHFPPCHRPKDDNNLFSCSFAGPFTRVEVICAADTEAKP